MQTSPKQHTHAVYIRHRIFQARENQRGGGSSSQQEIPAKPAGGSLELEESTLLIGAVGNVVEVYELGSTTSATRMTSPPGAKRQKTNANAVLTPEIGVSFRYAYENLHTDCITCLQIILGPEVVDQKTSRSSTSTTQNSSSSSSSGLPLVSGVATSAAQTQPPCLQEESCAMEVDMLEPDPEATDPCVPGPLLSAPPPIEGASSAATTPVSLGGDRGTRNNESGQRPRGAILVTAGDDGLVNFVDFRPGRVLWEDEILFSIHNEENVRSVHLKAPGTRKNEDSTCWFVATVGSCETVKFWKFNETALQAVDRTMDREDMLDAVAQQVDFCLTNIEIFFCTLFLQLYY